MGQVAEDMQDGTCCSVCGVWNDAIFHLPEGDEWKPPGYPWACSDCVPQLRPPSPTIKCPECGKRVKEVGLPQHMEAKHPQQGEG